jgi:hypothetical protein
LKQSGIDGLARRGHGGEPRNGLATTGDVDRIACFDPVDQLAEMGLGVRQIVRIHVTLLTM